jgi:two-component system sensor histidine kinase ChiS
MRGANLEGGQIEGFLLMTAPQTILGIDWSRVVIAMVDVSEQLAAQRRLQELVDSKDRFVASVSHELRTPLTTVIGLAEELRHQNTTIGPEERDELLELIGDQAMEVGNLVEDLLVAAQATIGRINVVPQAIRLDSELADLVGLLDLPNPPSIDVIGEIRPFADPRRFRQILRNLISNAYRYGGDIILISARREGETMVLEVRDNGDGIPDELQERIFEPYESAHKIAGLTESVGLGLTVSRELARLMNGSLTYYRTGGTTVFQLVLPAAEGNETEAVAAGESWSAA